MKKKWFIDNKTVKKVLKKHKVHPKKILGQNFLVDKNILEKIAKVTDVSSKETLLEIGAGIGNLTFRLAQEAKKVIAVEKDEKLSRILKQLSQELGIKNVEVITQDVLETKIGSLLSKTNKVVGNIPYYVTGRLLRILLEKKETLPDKIVLTVQKEVAERVCAEPPEMSLLAVSVQFYGKPEIVAAVPKRCFWPAPKVDSAIIKIVPKKSSIKKLPSIFIKKFFKIVRAGFSHPRKQLVNNLSSGLNIEKAVVSKILLKNNVNPTDRAEALGPKDWQKLAKSIKLK
ncbi:MAG: ribosomal RNA small subunit methyltransferase A [Candidatus Nealsonbacteria bacterium]|nr:ribosomal RNA small subunit methyltransferase A [Candidatus Nealsonbacteria bacterium]